MQVPGRPPATPATRARVPPLPLDPDAGPNLMLGVVEPRLFVKEVGSAMPPMLLQTVVVLARGSHSPFAAVVVVSQPLPLLLEP